MEKIPPNIRPTSHVDFYRLCVITDYSFCLMLVILISLLLCTRVFYHFYYLALSSVSIVQLLLMMDRDILVCTQNVSSKTERLN